MFRLDRTAFKIQRFEEATHQRDYWMQKTHEERLAAAWYLICIAWNLDPEKQHKLDRTIFSRRKQPLI